LGAAADNCEQAASNGIGQIVASADARVTTSPDQQHKCCANSSHKRAYQGPRKEASGLTRAGRRCCWLDNIGRYQCAICSLIRSRLDLVQLDQEICLVVRQLSQQLGVSASI
jgi:hypothetical protein